MMTGKELAAWRLKRLLTQDEAAKLLRIPLSTYKQREYGLRIIPGIMELAIEAIDHKYYPG